MLIKKLLSYRGEWMVKPGVSVILLRKKQVLLILRDDIPVWTLPGGGIEKGETPENAAIRECFEETGLKTVIKRKVGLYTPSSFLTSDLHLFLLEEIGGELCPSIESPKVEFFPLDSLPKHFPKVHKKFLEDCQKNYPFILKKKIEGCSLLELFLQLLLHPVFVLRFLWLKIAGYKKSSPSQNCKP